MQCPARVGRSTTPTSRNATPLAASNRGANPLTDATTKGDIVITMLKKLLFAAILCLRLVGFGLTTESQVLADDCPYCNPPPDCAPWENCS